MPWILGLGALLYFLSTMGVAEASVSPIEAKRIEQEAKRQAFIKENPESIAALQVTDPVRAAAMIAEGQAYTDSKLRIFNSLSPEERRNYKGGF